MSSSAITGRLTRKTEPHQKCVSRTPERTGPTAMPPIIAALQMPMAVPRCLTSENMLRRRASVEGISVAPPMPSSPRARMRVSAVGE